MKHRLTFVLAALLALLIAAPTGLLAQRGDGPGWGMGYGMRGGPGGGRGMMGGEWGMGQRGGMGFGCPMVMFGDDGKTETFVDGRIAFLKAELKITDAQEAVWKGYADALKNNMQTMKSMHQLMQTTSEADSLVERLDGRVAAMETRLNALKEMRPAMIKLYEALDESQRTNAEELLTVMGCMM
jgi:hypothetical protein